MSKLHFLNFNGFSVLDSRNIAEVLGESNQDLVREIHSYAKEIDEDPAMEASTYFFIPSAYISADGQIMPCYLISKIGCDYIAEKRSNKQCINQKEGEKMENISLLNFEGQDVLDSRDVAEMIGQRHTDLLRRIKGYINDIEPNAKLRPANFFIQSTYTDKNNQVRPCYLLTKQGCEFVANKMTGKKGNQFTAAYVGLFNSMKQELQSRQLDSYMIDDPVKRAERWIEERKAYEKVLPKAEYYDSQMRNPGLMTVTEIAKDYGWSGSSRRPVRATAWSWAVRTWPMLLGTSTARISGTSTRRASPPRARRTPRFCPSSRSRSTALMRNTSVCCSTGSPLHAMLLVVCWA